ncbi:MAG: metal ABC transporter substrate-binding protein [Planctomycetota bacterium]|jgi:zinc/manganese transport system substrate-binding protein/zinc transport system substrate-binding protein|nr:metal ABC transporter substrate-binding protein [Planctomycetota bacterium]
MLKMRIPVLFVACFALFPPALRAADRNGGDIKALCTTFPIYLIARNVAADVPGITVDLMIPAALGCPHDYALTPGDMRKLEDADVLIVNGLGMEEFLGTPVEKANPDLIQIDSSKGIDNLLEYPEDHDHEEEHEAEDHDHDHDEAEAEDHDHDHGHKHEGVNPHLYVSPSMAARLAENIAEDLARIVPDGAAALRRNAGRYRGAMERLVDQGRALGSRLANRRIVEPHGAFDYLARDLGLEIVGILQPHGIDLSAAGMLELLETIRREKPGAIFIEPQYSDKPGLAVSRETGIPLFVLDPVATGPDDAPLDYFTTAMVRNFGILENALGAAKK